MANHTTQYPKEVMVCADIDFTAFKPRSTRRTSTSKAFHLGSTLLDILKQGQWYYAKTLFHFFNVEKLKKMMAWQDE